METLVGPEWGSTANYLLMLIAVIVVILIAIIIVRIIRRPRFASGKRSRQARLAVTDAALVDSRRRLVLLRRDDVEHLIMIGGPTDIVIESDIRRNAPARADKNAESIAMAPAPALIPAKPPQPTTPKEPVQQIDENSPQAPAPTLAVNTAKATQPQPEIAPKPVPAPPVARPAPVPAEPTATTETTAPVKPVVTPAGPVAAAALALPTMQSDPEPTPSQPAILPGPGETLKPATVETATPATPNISGSSSTAPNSGSDPIRSIEDDMNALLNEISSGKD